MDRARSPSPRRLKQLGLLLAASSCTGIDDPCAALPRPTTLVDEEVALGESEPLVNDIAVDSYHLYWVDYFAGKVRRIATTGGQAATLGDADGPVRIAIDDQNAYWITKLGGVWLVPKSGGASVEVSPELSCNSGNCGRALAIDDTSVYWVDDSRIMSWPKAGGTPAEIDAPALSGYSDLAVDAANIYWMSLVLDQGPVIDPEYAAQATPKTGGASRTLAVFDHPWVGMAHDNANLYVAQSDGVWRIPKDGSGAVQLTTGALQPRSIAVDGARVYVVERDGVLSTPLDGGELLPIACDRQGAAYRITLDATTVYWNDEHADTILALPK